MKKAIITGISGQDGSLLAKYLINKKYKVLGFSRRDYDSNYFWRLGAYKDKLTIVKVNFEDSQNIKKIIDEFKPDEFYHLAAYVSPLINKNIYDVFHSNLFSTLNIIQLLKNSKIKFKLFIAGSCLMFCSKNKKLCTEESNIITTTPYSIAKGSIFQLSRNYKDVYNLHITTGILFNHVSEFANTGVVKKIIHEIAKINLGKSNELSLGNIDIQRDWGYAGDYVKAIHKITQNTLPIDYVVGTGVSTSLKKILRISFNAINKNWDDYVKIDKNLVRRSEENYLIADPSKIYNELGWKAEKSIEDIIELMLDYYINFEKKND